MKYLHRVLSGFAILAVSSASLSFGSVKDLQDRALASGREGRREGRS